MDPSWAGPLRCKLSTSAVAPACFFSNTPRRWKVDSPQRTTAEPGSACARPKRRVPARATDRILVSPGALGYLQGLSSPLSLEGLPAPEEGLAHAPLLGR